MAPILTRIDASGDQEFVAEALAAMKDAIERGIAARGRAVIGLSGGSTPGPVYEALGREKLDWSKVWLFLVDDRAVRPDSPHSNQFLVRSTLLRHAPVPSSQLLFPNTKLPLEDCIAEYQSVLTAAFKKNAPDLLVLGMGPDGHIASLFPLLSKEAATKKLVLHTTTMQFDIPDRISLSIPMLAGASASLFLLKGEKKLALWEKMLSSDEDVSRWPAKAILKAMPSTVIVGA